TDSAIILLSILTVALDGCCWKATWSGKFQVDRIATRWTRCFLKTLDNDVQEPNRGNRGCSQTGCRVSARPLRFWRLAPSLDQSAPHLPVRRLPFRHL